MSSISLNARQPCESGAWTYGWWGFDFNNQYDITNDDGSSLLEAAAYRASMSISSQEKLTECSVKVNLKNAGTGTGTPTVYCYLYTSDPTTGGAGASTVPSGYIKSTSASITLAANAGKYQEFTFTDLNITTGSNLYFLFTTNRGSATTWFIYLVNYNEGTSGSGTPTVTGTFVDMSTTVGTPTASVVDLTGNFPSTYIAGHSKVKVAAAVTTGTGSTISSVKLSYPSGTTVNMSYNSSTGKYEAVTAAPITRNTVFTVTATNSTGFTGTNTVSVTGVVPYTSPSVAINETGTYRCDSSGVKTSGGTHFRVQATANYYSSLSGNTLVKFSVKIKGSSTETNLTSGVQSAAISGMSNTNQGYTIVFTIQDKVSDAVTREYTLEGALRDFVLTRGTDNNGAHVGIGMTPEVVSGRSSIELPSGGRLLVNGEDIVFAPGTYTMTLPCFGDVSNSCKDVDCWFVPPKSLAACSGVSVSGATGCYIRISTGGYVGSGNADLTSYIRAGVSAIEGGTIRVTFRNAAGWTETNNITIAGVATLTFTLS